MKLLIQNKPMSIIECYEAVAVQMGYANTSELHYDCTKINVAENIQDEFYNYYTAIIREEQPTLSENDITTSITMILAMSGPKVDKDLKANEVEIFDGFIVS